MQVLGLFIVLATAADCLYFLDPTNTANSSSLAAVGIVLLILNMAYVAAMLILIAVTGANKTKHFTRTAFQALKTTSFKIKHSVSGLTSRASSVTDSTSQSHRAKQMWSADNPVHAVSSCTTVVPCKHLQFIPGLQCMPGPADNCVSLSCTGCQE